MSITDWLPTDCVPTLGPGCERVTLRNNILQLDFEVMADGMGVCRSWAAVDARRINEAHRFGMPTKGESHVSIQWANAQIRDLLAEGRRMAGSMAAWVLVEGGR